MIEEWLGYMVTPTTWVFLAAVAFLLAMVATIKICNTYDGAEVPAWLIFNWLFPLIGPMIALFYSPISENCRNERFLWREFLSEEPHRKFLKKNQQKEAFEVWRKDQLTASEKAA